MEANAAILNELEAIIETELKESERRIGERVNEVVVWELKESRMNIRKELMKFIVSLHELGIRRVEEAEALRKIYKFLPVGKSDEKIFSEFRFAQDAHDSR